MSTEDQPEAVANEFAIPRVYLSRAERAARRDEYDNLRRRYVELAGAARRFSADPRIGQKPLLELAGRLVLPGKAVFDALQEVDSPSEKASLPDEIERGIDLFASRLDPLADELKLLDRIHEYAGELHGLIAALAVAGRGPLQPLLGLARRILADVRGSSHGQLTQPLPGIDAALAIATIGAEAYPAIASCVPAILTARVVAWTAPQFLRLAADAELLTMGALLSDAGLIARHAVLSTPPALVPPADFRDHPRLGAALAGGIEGLPSLVPQLVAAHHERLDGSGYPARWNHWRIGVPQRLLQIATRFVELRFGADTAIAVSEPAMTDGVASRTLQDEAERGLWDVAWMKAFLSAIDQTPLTRPLDEPLTAPALTEFGRRRLRMDGAHGKVSAPHTAARVESVVGRPHFLRGRMGSPASVGRS
ncbi:MAG: hypothetical protein IT428_28015 [Planctomycetaceae bacterium]|nr:hypothetical protein [Planctomycetaceae bacterium]